jgi:hypothetical protein
LMTDVEAFASNSLIISSMLVEILAGVLSDPDLPERISDGTTGLVLAWETLSGADAAPLAPSAQPQSNPTIRNPRQAQSSQFIFRHNILNPQQPFLQIPELKSSCSL